MFEGVRGLGTFNLKKSDRRDICISFMDGKSAESGGISKTAIMLATEAQRSVQLLRPLLPFLRNVSRGSSHQ